VPTTTYVATSTYGGCGTCGGYGYGGGWGYQRLAEPTTQYYYVNQGPTYSGPGRFAPYPRYEENAIPYYGYRWHHHYYHRPYYGYRHYGYRHYGSRYGYPLRRYY
jgi:hypothetical protein